jgi:hypothetical protein
MIDSGTEGWCHADGIHQVLYARRPRAGFYELATKARVGSLPGEVYQVPVEALRLLAEQHIAYRRATDVEVKAAHGQVRNPAPAVL